MITRQRDEDRPLCPDPRHVARFLARLLAAGARAGYQDCRRDKDARQTGASAALCGIYLVYDRAQNSGLETRPWPRNAGLMSLAAFGEVGERGQPPSCGLPRV